MTAATASHNRDHRGDAHSIDELAGHLGGARPTLLAVWAHPDDESYLGAGLMAAVARRGGRVVNVTASLGEHGTDDPGRLPPTELAAIRRAELVEALATLGTDAPLVLGYEDGTCHRVPIALGARRISVIVDEVRPDAVLTFGPDGVTGHPDHRAIARWVELALTTRPELPLLTTAAGSAWPSDLVDGMHQIGAFSPGHPHRDTGPRTWHVRLEGHALEQKLAALAAHRSQIGPMQAVLGVSGYRRLASHEAYHPANPAAAIALSGLGAMASTAA